MANEFKLGTAIPQLPSGNIDITEKFFNEKLGFATVAKLKEQKFLIVRRESAEIHFWQAPSEQEARALGQEISCYIRVENIPPFFDDLKKRLAPFRYELTRQPWGTRCRLMTLTETPFGLGSQFDSVASSPAREIQSRN